MGKISIATSKVCILSIIQTMNLIYRLAWISSEAGKSFGCTTLKTDRIRQDIRLFCVEMLEKKEEESDYESDQTSSVDQSSNLSSWKADLRNYVDILLLFLEVLDLEEQKYYVEAWIIVRLICMDIISWWNVNKRVFENRLHSLMQSSVLHIIIIYHLNVVLSTFIQLIYFMAFREFREEYMFIQMHTDTQLK